MADFFGEDFGVDLVDFGGGEGERGEGFFAVFEAFLDRVYRSGLRRAVFVLAHKIKRDFVEFFERLEDVGAGGGEVVAAFDEVVDGVSEFGVAEVD